MTEYQHQCAVVRALAAARVYHCSSMAGVNLNAVARGRANRAGYVAGEPDLRIYDPPPAHPECVGTMLEMKVPSKAPKTSRAGPYSGCEPHQKRRLTELAERGWYCIVGYGAYDALHKLRLAGYPV